MAHVGLMIILISMLMLLHIKETLSCNEVLCASVVSKCMLTQACNCKIAREKNDCACCSDCAICLGQHYERCCTCVGMCSDSEVKLDENDSVVGAFNDAFPVLFRSVTESDDKPLYTTITFPIDVDLTDTNNTDLNKIKVYLENSGQYTNAKIHKMNCTVAYVSQCTSNVKCKKTCSSIGASSYRFFFNGCCECVGITCINYGLNEIKCNQCPEVGDDEYDEEIHDDLALINTLEPDQTL